MVVTKSQIRPRRKRFHFSNAEILLLDTTGVVVLVAPAPLGQGLSIEWIQIYANIAVDYATISVVNPFIQITDDFNFGTFAEDDAGATLAFSNIFAPGGPAKALLSYPPTQLPVDSFNEAVPINGPIWTDFADLHANGGIFMTFNNGGTDLTAGDPANFLDIFLDYKIIDLA